MTTATRQQVTVTISIHLSDVISHDLDEFLDLIAERCGYPLLMDIGYKIVGCGPDNNLILEVTGEVDWDSTMEALDIP